MCIICSASNGVVLATENKNKSILYEEHSVAKVEMITSHIGMVYSGKSTVITGLCLAYILLQSGFSVINPRHLFISQTLNKTSMYIMGVPGHLIVGGLIIFNITWKLKLKDWNKFVWKVGQY